MIHSSLRYLVVGLLLCCSMVAQGQFFEGGLILGGTVYEGDLSPKAIGDKFANIRPAGGLFVRQNFNENWAARLSFTYGTMTAADGADRRARGLSFEAPYGEIAALAEFSWPGYDPTAYKRISPYAFAGIALTHYTPKAEYQGRLVELQPLGTEGQGLDGYDDFYSLDIFAIPFGGGIKYALSPSLTIAAEFGARLTFTDYLDDVSGAYPVYADLATQRSTTAANLSDPTYITRDPENQIRPAGALRGDPNYNDWYFIGNITISYHFYDLFGGLGNCPSDF